VITADEGRRGGRAIPLKKITDEALLGLDIARVLVYKHTGTAVPMAAGRDVWWEDTVVGEQPVDRDDD
jgi:acyl-coenzyme A synthetase/AMP-(fatty) acid ligase